MAGREAKHKIQKKKKTKKEKKGKKEKKESTDRVVRQLVHLTRVRVR